VGFCRIGANSFKRRLEMGRKFDEKDADREFRDYSKKVDKDDLESILNAWERIEKKFKNYEPLNKFIDVLKLFYSLLKDFCTGRYTDVPWVTIAAIVGALVYVLSPLDAIPDIIPFLGFVDDAAVIGCCLKFIQGDLEVYKAWLEGKGK
jgi:uncharacterized membrane protein YkvA (DUF1232 family)